MFYIKLGLGRLSLVLMFCVCFCASQISKLQTDDLYFKRYELLFHIKNSFLKVKDVHLAQSNLLKK